MPPTFISTILQSVRKENLAHYFPYDVKLGLLADSRSFLANQKARNAIVGAENLLIIIIVIITIIIIINIIIIIIIVFIFPQLLLTHIERPRMKVSCK